MDEQAGHRRSDQQEAEEVRIGWRMAGIGTQVASEVVAGAILGYLFDLWRGTGRIGLIVGALVGIAVGLWSLMSQSLKLNRELERVAPTKGRGRPLPPDPDDDRDQENEDEDFTRQH